MNRNIYAIILIILAIGLYFTVTQGIIDDAKLIKSSNTEYSTAINNAKRLIEVRDKVISDYNQLSSEDRIRLDKIVPNTVDNIRLIIDMNDVARKHGLSLRAINVSVGGSSPNPSGEGQEQIIMDPINNNGIVAVPILDKLLVTFSVSAPYQQFISFIQDIEANLRIMDITSLSVSVNNNGIYDWTITLKTYWLRNP